MFKRILKIVGIVLGCTIVGVGILTGVLALQGKFKKPYQEPNSIYFDIENDTLNVTYYCNNFVASNMDSNYELLNQNPTKKLNVYSFVLKATPDNVTELDCTMVVEKGSELIEFCTANGNPYAGGTRSKIKIGERVYFKIKNDFDNSIDNDTTANYEKTKGEVKLYFNTSNNLHNAYLTIKIDRQTSQVSLFDFKNPLNNEHTNGVFNYETSKFEQVATPNENNVENYFVKEIDEAGSEIYRSFGKNIDGTVREESFDADGSYFIKRVEKTLNITIEANSDYELKPIFSPDHSNSPFGNDAKLCNIYYLDKVTDNYYLVGDSSHNVDYIFSKNGSYYFNANQAGSYELYVVTYPTYKVYELFQQNFESDNVSDVIFNNNYAITRKVVFTVENSGVQEVYFNNGNALNLNFDLFKDNSVAVHNTASSKNLDITMLNNLYESINSRFDQLTFLNNSHFVAGNVKFVGGEKTIFIGQGQTSATISGFEGYNGTHAYTTSYNEEDKQILLMVKVDGKDDLVLKIPCEIEKADGIYKVENGKVAMSSVGEWTMNDILLINQKTTNEEQKTYTLGTLAVGSYIVMTKGNNNEFVNDKFSVTSSNFGINKQFNITPLEHLTEVSMYCLVVNTDNTIAYTNMAVNIQINYESADISRIFEDVQPIKIKTSSQFQSFKIEDLARQSAGTYQFPLMFVESSDIKVKTIPQIYFENNGKKYVLVGRLENGRFVNEVVPLTNCIGSQNIYVRMVKYNCGQVDSYNALYNMLMSNVSASINDVTLNRTFYEPITLTQKPESWADYYKLEKEFEAGVLQSVSIKKVQDDEEFDSTATYLRTTNNLFVGAYVDNVGVIGQVSNFEIKTKNEGGETQNYIFVKCYQIINSSTFDIDIENALCNINNISEDFNNNPIATLNIVYVDKLDENDDQEASSNLNFSMTFYKNEGTISPVENMIEVFEGQKGKTGEVDMLYAKIEIDSNYQFNDLIAMIAGTEQNIGLNKFYNLKVNMYNYANNEIGNIYSTANLEYEFDNNENIVYKFSNNEINQYFIVQSITLEKEEGKQYIKVLFDVGENELDNFENYLFTFEFVYGEEKAESVPIKIKSTAVTGYKFKVGENTYSFDDYKIVYKISYNNAYKYVSYLTQKKEYLEVKSPVEEELVNYYLYDSASKIYVKVEPDAEFSVLNTYYVKAEKIQLTSGVVQDEKLLDNELLKVADHISNYFVATNETHKKEEFDFNISNTNDNVLSIVGDEIEILNKGTTVITLTNQTKTSVKSSFDVEIDSTDFVLSATTDKKEVTQSTLLLDDDSNPVFKYEYNAEPVVQLFNTEKLVDLNIANVQPVEFAVSEDCKRVVDKTSKTEYENVSLTQKPATGWNGYYTYDEATQKYISVPSNADFYSTTQYYQLQYATVLKVEYVGGKWQLMRKEKYVLSVFSFELVATTKFTDSVSCQFSYVSPVNIELNANHPMCNDVVTYYEGTTLQLSSKNGTNESAKTLFKLTDNTNDGTSTQFKLQIEWYKQLTVDDNKPFSRTFYKYENNKFVNVEESDDESYNNNPENFYEKMWIDINNNSNSFTLSLDNNINSLSHLPFEEKINARIYYNENKYYTFKFVVKHNVFIEVNTINDGSVSQNSIVNPQTMNIGEEQEFATIFSIKKLSNIPTYYAYTNNYNSNDNGTVDYKEIIDATYSLRDNTMFTATDDNKLKLDWIDITGEKVYGVPITIEIAGVNFAQNYYVKATSQYSINLTASLPTIEAYKEINFDVNNYFTIKNIDESIADFSATIKCFVDSAMTQEDNNLNLVSKQLKYSYPYISNGVRFVEFTFKFDVDGVTRTLTNQVAYPIYINNFESIRNSEVCIAGEQIEFVRLFDGFCATADKLFADENAVYKIVFENNNDINYFGEPILTKESKTFKIQPVIKGQDYSTTIDVNVYYDDSNPNLYYTYQLVLEVKNPTKAKIENVMFDDLKLNINNNLVDLDGNQIDFVETLHYQPVLAGEIVDKLTDKFAIYDADGDKLTDSKYSLTTIELFGTINLVGDPSYKSKLTIDNASKTIAIGDFTRVGYAVFRLSDSEGTSCYYALRITPKTISISEKYTNVIKTDNSKQYRSTLEYKHTTDGSNVAEFLKANYTNMALATGIAESVLTSNNIYYYLKSTDQVSNVDYIVGTNYQNMLNQVVNDCEIAVVNNPTRFVVSVLIKTTNAEVYLCDVAVTVMPNVSVEIKGNTTQLDGDFTYSRDVKYSYGATNEIEFNNILIVDSSTITSVAVSYVSENNISISTDNLNTILTISTASIVLNKNISEEITITLKLTYGNGLEVTLIVVYLPFENANTTRTYKLGWNGTGFDTTISRYTLVPDYTGEITATLNGVGMSLEDDEYEFVLAETEQTKTLVLTLTEIQGQPSYTFTIILGSNINQTIYYGKTENDSVKTILDGENNQSTLVLSGNNTTKLKLATGNMETDTTILVVDYKGSINVSSVKFYTLAGNETSFVKQDGTTLKFVASATDIAGKLVIYTNIGQIEIYITIAKTYVVEANYRITKTNAGTTTHVEYETVKVNSTLSFDDFMSTSLNALTLDNVTINSSRFAVKKIVCCTSENEPIDWNNYNLYYKLIDGKYTQLTQTETYVKNTYYYYKTVDLLLLTNDEANEGVNKVSWQVMFASANGLVADSNNIYHTLNINSNTITFKNAGTVYIRLTNSTGLVLDYKINIQDDAYFVDNITWNTDNKNTDMEIVDGKITTAPTYFSTDIATLTDTTTNGYKLASLTFNPSDVTDITYFRLYVKSFKKNESLITGTNVYNASDETRGSFEVADGITLSYRVENFNILLTASGTTNDIEFGEFEIYFITLNGVSNKITLYITNITIESGVDIGLESIYANQEELSLSTNLVNNKTRLSINNVKAVSYNTNTGYQLFFNGWKNETTGLEYAKNDTSLVVVSPSNDYRTDVFSLRSIATDNQISLHYYLTYNGKKIATFDYSFVIKNDINITMNNFDNTSDTAIGNIYLNNYEISSNTFSVDLINKTADAYYRNEYIIYKNLRTNKIIFEGEKGSKNVANYMKFELIDSYFATEDTHNSYTTRDKFLKGEVSIDENGVLSITADKSGKIGVKVTAQNCPTYSIILELNVHATINVAQKYADNEYDSSAGGYESLAEITLISYDSGNKNAMIYLDKTSASSTIENNLYKIVNSELNINPTLTISYAIKSNISEVATGNYTTVTQTFNNKTLKLNFPVVPFSATERYIVSYKLDLSENNTTRTYYANYLVKNSEGMTERDYYKSKVITVGDGAQNGNNLTIYKQLLQTDNVETATSLFTGQKEIPTLLGAEGATQIQFQNIVDATSTTPRTFATMFEISNSSGTYSIDLGTLKIFSNQMTFDIVFLNSNNQELYRSSGWTMKANGQVTPKHSKAFIDLFTEAELGNELIDKNFVAVTDQITANTGWFSTTNVTVDDAKSTQVAIERNGQTYTIYSFIAKSENETSSFYDLQGTFYFISGTPTNFIEITDNYYVSYIVENVNDNLTLDIKNYVTVFKGIDFSSSEITSIAFAGTSDTSITVNGATVSKNNTEISISSADFNTLVNNEISLIEFSITISGGNASRTVKVRLTLPTT